MTTPSDRLRQARELAGFIRAADAAAMFGWQLSTYYGHENGSRGLRPKTAATYAQAFKVSPEWLLFGRSATQPRSLPDDLEPQDRKQKHEPSRKVLPTPRLLTVPPVLGDSKLAPLAESDGIAAGLALPKSYLAQLSEDLSLLRVHRVGGDAMAPTLIDGDLILVDLAQNDPIADGLYLFRDLSGSLWVKRIGRLTQSDRLMIISDNAAYRSVEIGLADLEVVGRIVWRGRKL